jgi:hypothetical protein
MASPVATFSPARLRTMTSISTQRDLCVVCFDLTMPLGRPGPVGDHARHQAQNCSCLHDDAAELVSPKLPFI